MGNVVCYRYLITPDNRRLRYLIAGNLKEQPMLFFHGFPGSCIEGMYYINTLISKGYYLISIDRPGIGLSTIQKERSMKTLVKDVNFLLESLDISQITIAAVSGGVPYALAVAALHSNNYSITKLIMASGMGPPVFHQTSLKGVMQLGLKIVHFFPKFTRYFFENFIKPAFFSLRSTSYICRFYEFTMPLCDRKCLANDFIRKMFIKNKFNAFISTSYGMVQDLQLYGQSWGFSFSKISSSLPIIIIHGKKDRVIKYQMSIDVSKKFSNSELHIYDNEGHFSALYHNIGKFL